MNSSHPVRLAYSRHSINAACVHVIAEQESAGRCPVQGALRGLPGATGALPSPVGVWGRASDRCSGSTATGPQSSQSSSRAALSSGDWSTSEFLASRLRACCSRIFWDLARSQSVLTRSLFHTTEVSVSLTYPSSPV